MLSVGSRQELEELSGNPEAKTVELHRPYIDAITIPCPKCGKPTRVGHEGTGKDKKRVCKKCGAQFE